MSSTSPPRPSSAPDERPIAKGTTRSYAAVSEALAAADPVIARLFAETGPVNVPRSHETHFAALVRAIVYQQLNERVAHIIYGRLVAALAGTVEPSAVATLSQQQMRAAGMSQSKALALHDLADRSLDGRLDLRTRHLARQSDALVIAALTTVRGIGPWSAQMFMMFQLRRLNVWPTADLGIRRGYGIAWNIRTPTARELEPLGDPYRPYRTVLALYCWRADWRARAARD